ncbi:MAG: NADH-quinone oxidoreductase subunit M [Phycisphaeraceae bacterium]
MNFHDYLIPILVLLPALGALCIALIPAGRDGEVTKGFALINTLVTLALSVLLAASYNWSSPGNPQFATSLRWVDSFGLSFAMGLPDSISLWLVLLTTFLMPIIVLGSFSALSGDLKRRTREFYLWLLLLQTAMMGTFVATDLIFFYICFEFTLVPLYFLIGIFGSTQRLKAARVFFLYTFTGSMLTFAGVLYVAWYYASLHGEWTFDLALLTEAARSMPLANQKWVLLALLAGFAVKVPLFPFHTWLPLAHTEAPTAGSVILAGVLLKLGTYGLLRLAIPMTPDAVVEYAPCIATLAIIGILYTALICWVQKDLKKLIAYSSVSHLGFCVLGLFAINTIGGSGSVMYMINHGLSTGALFLCVGMIYERFHTREMSQMNGLGKVMPVWGFFMVFFTLASVGLPGLNGFVGEFLTLLGAFRSDLVLGGGSKLTAAMFAGVAGLGMIFGAIYLLYMVGRVVFGPVKLPAHDHDAPAHAASANHGGAHHGVTDLNWREIVTLTPLALACLWLGLYPAPVLDSLGVPIDQVNAAAMSSANHRVVMQGIDPLSPGERAGVRGPTDEKGAPVTWQPAAIVLSAVNYTELGTLLPGSPHVSPLPEAEGTDPQ